MFEKYKSIGIGISNTISISKTIKIIASKKNRIENGTRALWFGSNPHSNGEHFSRSDWDRIDTTQEILNTTTGKKTATEAETNNIFIN